MEWVIAAVLFLVVVIQGAINTSKLEDVHKEVKRLRDG